MILKLLLVIGLALNLWLVFLPHHYRRPIQLKGIKLATLIGLVCWTLSFATHPAILLIGILFVILSLLLNPWIVWGVSPAKLSQAIEKAAQATRSPISSSNNQFLINEVSSIKYIFASSSLCYIQCRNINNTKKSKLFVKLLEKFINNYQLSK